MRSTVFLLFLLCFSQVYGFSIWKTLPGLFWKRKDTDSVEDDFGIYRKGISTTGRVFVAMFGYPRNCERKGSFHSCTLSLACWLIGGTSQSGCGASPWLVACCVTKKTGYNVKVVNKNEGQGIGNVQTRENIPVIQKRNNILLEEDCGLSADRVLSKRIIGGNEARFGQFPWQVYIKILSYQCGGVLVSRRYVATAAHCVVNVKLNQILVYLGELDTQDTGKVDEFAPAELHRVRRKLIHPDFQFRTTQPDRFDLALLDLITEAGYAAHISPICLPLRHMPLIGREAVVAGWGKIKPNGNSLTGTNLLRSTKVPILDIIQCTAWHQQKHINVDLHDDMMCAGDEDGLHDACVGDSGGPLIILEGGKWTLVGITSAGFGCGEPRQPGIYHKVTTSVDWMRKVIDGGE